MPHLAIRLLIGLFTKPSDFKYSATRGRPWLGERIKGGLLVIPELICFHEIYEAIGQTLKYFIFSVV